MRRIIIPILILISPYVSIAQLSLEQLNNKIDSLVKLIEVKGEYVIIKQKNRRKTLVVGRINSKKSIFEHKIKILRTGSKKEIITLTTSNSFEDKMVVYRYDNEITFATITLLEKNNSNNQQSLYGYTVADRKYMTRRLIGDLKITEPQKN